MALLFKAYVLLWSLKGVSSQDQPWNTTDMFVEDAEELTIAYSLPQLHLETSAMPDVATQPTTKIPIDENLFAVRRQEIAWNATDFLKQYKLRCEARTDKSEELPPGQLQCPCVPDGLSE